MFKVELGRNISKFMPWFTRLFLLPLTTFSLVAAQEMHASAVPSAADWAKLPAHPRLFASAARVEALKTQADEVSRQLLVLAKSEAEEKLALEPIAYPANGLMLWQMRDVQGRILALALCYRLTGDKRTLAKAREELLRLADLPDWHPAHFLDVGEAALAAGTGLDWLYDDLSPDDRDRIARAIVNNALLPSLEVKAGGDSWVNGDFNWAQVCHGGLVVGALAIAEREPALAQQIVERAVNNMGNVGTSYAPDGSYAEGPSYWSYGSTFHVILIEVLRSALGTGCGLEKFPGFLKTADYKNQMLAPTGEEFNYSDYHNEHHNEPIMLWFARERCERNVARNEFADLTRLHDVAFAGAKATSIKQLVASRHLPLELLWWDPSLTAGTDSRSRHWTASGVLPIAVMRSAWDDPAASFIAIKGGTPNHSHAHMDVGSFILEADGVRWALDLGTEDYDKMRDAGIDLWNYTQNSSRWTTFRVGPEGHNILRFDGAYQNVGGKAETRALPDDHGTMGNVVELTPLYAGQVADVRRSVKLHPDRTMSIEDEWTAAERAVTASWQWLTKAKVTRTPTGLLLEEAGRTLTLKVELPAETDAKIKVEDVSVPRAPQDSANANLSRIVITVPTPAKASVKLRVQIIPGTALPH